MAISNPGKHYKGDPKYPVFQAISAQNRYTLNENLKVVATTFFPEDRKLYKVLLSLISSDKIVTKGW